MHPSGTGVTSSVFKLEAACRTGELLSSQRRHTFVELVELVELIKPPSHQNRWNRWNWWNF